MREAVKSKEATLLTLNLAKSLKGKKINTIYFGYAGQDGVKEFVVGDVVTELEYQETQPMEGWNSRADYWRSYMSEKKLSEVNNKLILLDEEGNYTFIFIDREYSFDDIFCCSDSDRCVFFIECNDEN